MNSERSALDHTGMNTFMTKSLDRGLELLLNVPRKIFTPSHEEMKR